MKQNIWIIKIIIFIISFLLNYSPIFAQNSLIGDGFGGRSWYVAHNYQVGAYTGYTVCGIDSQLHVWGGNPFGELGNGTTISTTTPISVQTANHVKFYSTGYISAVIKNDNSLWAWGVANSFPGGDPASGLTNFPQYLTNNVKFVDCGMNHAVFVKSDGTVWGIGQNVGGQLGNGTTSLISNPVTTPVQMLGINNAVRAIAVGVSYPDFTSAASVILLSDGTVKVTGGYRRFTDVLTYVPITISGLNNIIDIKGGTNSAVALNNIGEVYAFGSDYKGSLGGGFSIGYYTPPTKINFPVGAAPIIALSANCDGNSTLALDENGNVYAWGVNEEGQLGDGTFFNLSTPKIVATNVIDIFAGETFSYILKSDNTLWCSGTSGYLTNGYNYGSIWMNLSNVPRSVFTQINPTSPIMNLCVPFTFGTVPVRLLSFNCTAEKNIVSLNWRSGEELNLDKYILQYSFDAANFLDLDNIAAKGGYNNYLYNCKQTNNIAFYRLKMVDKDGTFTYSDIRSIKTKTANKFSILPNPSSDIIYLQNEVDDIIKLVEVFSYNGERLKIINNFNLGQPLNISSLAKGFYIIKLTTLKNKIEFLKLAKVM